MELKDTIEMMNSEDYNKRFKAEYLQVKTRYDKLDDMTVKYEAGTLNFTPKCSLELLKEQKKYMEQYIRCLKIRAEIEGVDLKNANYKHLSETRQEELMRCLDSFYDNIHKIEDDEYEYEYDAIAEFIQGCYVIKGE